MTRTFGIGIVLFTAVVAFSSLGYAAEGRGRGAPAPAPAADPRGAPAPVAANNDLDIGADAPADAPSDGNAKKPLKKDKKKSFDNSRTDINVYNKTVSDKDRVKSLFFTAAEVNDVHLAVNTYLKNIGRGGDLTFDEEAFLSRLGGLKKSVSTTAQSQFFTYPQFFLDSLVFYSAKDWLVWINSERITQDTPRENSNIHVTEITPDHVTVEWFPLEMDRVVQTWKKYPNNDIKVDVKHGQVIFTLKPNQTFSSYTMSVLEGRVLPVTVDVSTTNYTVPLEEEPKPEKNVIGDEGKKSDNPAPATAVPAPMPNISPPAMPEIKKEEKLP